MFGENRIFLSEKNIPILSKLYISTIDLQNNILTQMFRTDYLSNHYNYPDYQLVAAKLPVLTIYWYFKKIDLL